MHRQGYPVGIILPTTVAGALVPAVLLAYSIERPTGANLRAAYSAIPNSWREAWEGCSSNQEARVSGLCRVHQVALEILSPLPYRISVPR